VAEFLILPLRTATATPAQAETETMTNLRVALIGAAGRMGQAIIALAKSEGVEVVARIDLGDQLTFADADVAIDFSHADAARSICEVAIKSKTPLVIGTTAHSAKQRDDILAVSKQIPVVLASNFSVGVSTLFALTEHAAKILGDDFDLEIVEAHHRMKKDAPSGTAKALAEILQRARQMKVLRHGREGIVGERGKSEIGIHSVRGGDVVGDHTVIFAGQSERLELTHRASSRDTFARGAIRAARWLIGKSPGLYDMRDVLGLSHE
jgi:4-hydroxy-tetrahydrodipicolinate reductase